MLFYRPVCSVFPSGIGLLLCFLCGSLFGQQQWSTTNCPQSRKEAHVWYFGEKAGISFLSGPASPLTDQNVMSAIKATSAICDSMGNLLFFTNGDKVWDRTFTLMPNATDLMGDLGATQPCIIVPWPEDSSLYYIFTVDILKFTDNVNYTTNGLTVTIIDLKLRGGLGDAQAEVLNKPLLSPVTQKITAVKHQNGKDYWVIAHKWNSDEFYAWHISRYGMAPPVVSSTGGFHGGDKTEANNALGYLKASPDGTRLALAVTQSKLIELFDFDNESGTVSNPRSYTTNFTGIHPYGIEFSPDSRFLYATALEITGTGKPSYPSRILQFDTRNGLPAPTVVDSVAGIRIAGIQLAPDGRIYLSRTINIFPNNLKDSLEVIYNPNRPGTACNFNHLEGSEGMLFPLSGRKSVYSLPNIVQSFVNVPAFTWGDVCEGQSTGFKISNTANIDSVRWDFGDGGRSSDFLPSHTFTTPGVYTVALNQYYLGEMFTDSMKVSYYPLPKIALTDTVLLYTGSSINLRAGKGFARYLWSTASVDSVITVETQGTYIVEVEDFNCCRNSDTTYVKVFGYYIPNAFTPNGDGINDVFRVSGLYRQVKFRMVVYDRWGRMVFQSSDISKGWDGSYAGKLCEPDAYVWIVEIAFSGDDIITSGDLRFKGTVTLIK